MPQCPYCKQFLYASYCYGFARHVDGCRNSFEKIQQYKENEIEKLRHENELLRRQLIDSKPSVTNNYTLIQVNTLYQDFPENDMTVKVLEAAKSLDLKLIKSPEDLDEFVSKIQDLNGKELERCLSGKDRRAQSQALSFLANVVRVIRERIQKERPQSLEVVEAAEQFEQDCLKDKQLIVL